MSGLQHGYPCLVIKEIKTDTATTDAATVTVPFTGKGYTVRRVTVYNSRLSTTGATANGATASISIRGTSGGAGTTIVTDAALTGLTGNTVVLDLTVAATGVTPIVDDVTLYIRVGTASGVTNSIIDMVIEYVPLP